MWRLVAECKKPGCNSLLPFSTDGEKRVFDNEIGGIVALVDVQRHEIRTQLVNGAWKPAEFERAVKAFEHPLSKDIQAHSIPITCQACKRTYLYSSLDAFLVSE